MKRVFLILLFLLVPNLVRAQQKKALSAASGTCTTTSCLTVTVDPTQGGATLTVSANASGNTVQFEASGDGGTTVVALNATPSNSSTAASSTTSTGTWQVNTAGYTNIYLRMSALVGGTTTVSIIQSTASARGGSGGGGGGSAVLTCSTTGGVAFETSANNLGCDPSWTFSSTAKNQLMSINPLGGFTRQGQISLLGDGTGDCDGQGDPCLEYLVPNGPTAGTLVRVMRSPGQPATSSFQEAYSFDSGSGLSTYFTDSTHLGPPLSFSDSTFSDNGYMDYGAIGGVTATNSGQFEIDSPNATVTMRKGHIPNMGYDEIMHIQFDASNNILIQPVAGSLTKIGKFGGTNFATFGDNGEATVPTLSTTTNCKANGTAANPSVVACSAASAGMFSCATAATTGTCQVNTTAVTANSEIFITQDAADGGASQLNVTCNTALVTPAAKPILLSKNAGTSFTINLGTVSVNPGCFEYHIVN